MGISGISTWQLLVLLAVVALVFGTGKLRSAGKDIGEGIRGLRKGIEDKSDEG